MPRRIPQTPRMLRRSESAFARGPRPVSAVGFRRRGWDSPIGPRAGNGVECRAMKATLAFLLLLVAAPTVAPGADPTDPKPERLVGTWRSRTRLGEGTGTIPGDG